MEFSKKLAILAVAGSLRPHSSTHQVLDSVSRLLPPEAAWKVFDGLADLPHFNDDPTPSASVEKWRQAILEADGILICTPEYGFGAPGFLKNALDWTISSGEFVDKPVALITAATMGENAHASLLLTLKGITAAILPEATLHIPNIRAKLTKTGELKDADTLEKLTACVHAFLEQIKANKQARAEKAIS